MNNYVMVLTYCYKYDIILKEKGVGKYGVRS